MISCYTNSNLQPILSVWERSVKHTHHFLKEDDFNRLKDILPSIMKQVREGTFMFENANFSTAEVGYRTDLSPGFEFIPFNKNGKGDWGTFVWSNQNWGGGFSGVPFRTYIPLSKMKCRFIQASFVHNSAREKWAIFGISYTLRGISERAYRS